jgi:hypothetical protein
MKEHGGDIVAYNHIEGGAVFVLKLPIAGREKNSGETAISSNHAGWEH